MVRGLLIRQGFIVLDLTLALVLVGTVGMVVAKLFEPPRETLTASYDSEDTKNSNQFVPEVIARSGYDRIVTNRLFGDAGAWDPAAEPAPAPAPEPVEQPIEETPLKLVLLGTTAMSPKDPFGSAVIENQEAGGYVKNFGMGEQIVAVHRRGVMRHAQDRTTDTQYSASISRPIRKNVLYYCGKERTWQSRSAWWACTASATSTRTVTWRMNYPTLWRCAT